LGLDILLEPDTCPLYPCLCLTGYPTALLWEPNRRSLIGGFALHDVCVNYESTHSIAVGDLP